MTDAGLAPFLFWWHRFPAVPLFAAGAGLLLLSSLFLLVQINRVLHRLCAMLPDETLRAETKLFTGFNITFLLGVFAGLGGAFLVVKTDGASRVCPGSVGGGGGGGVWLGLFLVLLPVAMTMALVWKIREVIFSSLLAAGG